MIKENKVLKKILATRKDINLEVLHELIRLAVEIAREGREGRKIGTLFIFSDSENTLKKSKSMILDPLAGHPESRKNIYDFNMRETVKELAQLDGAFIVSDEGVILSACRYICADSSGVSIPLGLGARHMAAAAITSVTKSVAVVVSENSIVRVFDKGELVTEIIPELWLMSSSSIQQEGGYSRDEDREITVISRKK